jgi:hypothetical protein
MSSSPTCSTALLLLLPPTLLLLLPPTLLLLLLFVPLLSTWLQKAYTQSRSTIRAAADMYVAEQQRSTNEG